MNLMLASHECTCADMLWDLSLVAGLVRREPLGRGLDRRCEVGCLLHVNFGPGKCHKGRRAKAWAAAAAAEL